MKIVFVYPFLLHYQSPRIAALAKECERAGVSCYNLALTSYMEDYRQFFEKSGHPNAAQVLFPGHSLENVPVDSMWPALKTTLEELHPDVLFLYGYSEAIFRRAFFWAKSRKIATAIVSDSNLFDKKRYFPLEFLKKILVSRFDAAFVGGTSASLYMQSLGIPPERIVPGFDVVDNGFFADRANENQNCAMQLRQEWNLPPEFFLFVGRLIKEKNLIRLFDAYSQYVQYIESQTHPWDLVLCGGGPEQQALQAHLLEFPAAVRERIHLYGHVRQPEIIDFYSCASCFVLPSVSESWGLVVNEAMACGLPVIVSTKAGCALDLVEENVNGWCIDPYNIEELANRMIQISTCGEEARLGMSLRGKEIIARWGLDRFSQGVLACAGIAMQH